MSEVISPDLRNVLKRLRLSGMLETLPERLVSARQQKMPYQDFMLLMFGDEAQRRQSQAVTFRTEKAKLDGKMRWELWDETSKVTFDRNLLQGDRKVVKYVCSPLSLGHFQNFSAKQKGNCLPQQAQIFLK
jgi:hypothetical protein